MALLATAWGVFQGVMNISAVWKWLASIGGIAGVFGALRGFAFRPPGSYIVLACLLLGAGYGYGWYQYNQGYAAAEAVYEERIEEERERQADVRRRAAEDADRRIQELEDQVDSRDATLQDIINRTSDRTGPGLSAGSLRELNRID